MKKLLLALLTITFFAMVGLNNADAATVAVAVNAKSELSNDEVIKGHLMDRMQKIFPSTTYQVLPLDEVSNFVNNHRAEYIGNRNTEEKFGLQQEDMLKLGRALNCDYLVLVQFVGSASDVKDVPSKDLFSNKSVTSAFAGEAMLFDIKNNTRLAFREFSNGATATKSAFLGIGQKNPDPKVALHNAFKAAIGGVNFKQEDFDKYKNFRR